MPAKRAPAKCPRKTVRPVTRDPPPGASEPVPQSEETRREEPAQEEPKALYHRYMDMDCGTDIIIRKLEDLHYLDGQPYTDDHKRLLM